MKTERGRPASPRRVEGFVCGALVAAAAVSMLGACSTGTTGEATAGAGGSTGHGSGAGATSGTAGTFSVGSGPATGTGGGCAGISASASPSAANVLILLDLSGSMNSTVEFGDVGWPVATRYTATRDALNAVIPNLSPDLRMGLVYFGHGAQPVTGCTLAEPGCCTRDSTNGGPDIPILPLDAAQKMTLTDFINSNGGNDNNNTPTQDALIGAYDIMTNSSLDGSHFVLVITDGNENCGGDWPTTIANSAAAATGSPSVRTFVIGSPGSQDARQPLSDVAKQGGTAKTPGCTGAPGDTCHYDLTGSGVGFAGLPQALTDILGSVVVPCVYNIPDQGGGMFDPNQVNVEYSSGGGPAQSIPQDPNTPCDQAAGWQYSPDGKQIIICGAACQTIQADPAAEISIVFGCPTILK